MVLVALVVLREETRVLGQRGSDLLLLLEATGVGDLDVASLGGRFIHDLLQLGIELAVFVVCGRVRLLLVVAAVLRWDLVQNFGLRFLLA